jgi:hypothetical protein
LHQMRRRATTRKMSLAVTRLLKMKEKEKEKRGARDKVKGRKASDSLKVRF